MKKLFLMIAAAMSMTMMLSCGSQNKANMIGSWLITEAYGVNAAGGENQAEISFDRKGNVNGNASVNTFMGDYRMDGETLTIGNVAKTMRMGASMEVEDAVSKSINTVKKVKVDGDKATFYDADGKAIMKLQRKK